MVFKPMKVHAPASAVRPRNFGQYRTAFITVFFLMASLSSVRAGGFRDGTDTMETRDLVIERVDGSVEPVQVELAFTEQERARGLMHREELADGEGMLFIFDRDQILSFWMKDTLIPLSIAFIAFDGRIVEIHDMEPKSLLPVYSTRSVRYALEVPQGWFDRVGIFPGDRIRLEL